jgi:putative glutamine amidotransferase
MTGASTSNTTGARIPVVWVVSSRRDLRNEHGHSQQYIVIDQGGVRALLKLGLRPVSYPGLPPEHIDQVLDSVQGVLLGGSATSVHPRHYGQEEPPPSDHSPSYDEERDALALPLVRRCVDRQVPLIGFCRGSHEVNVALGGSLYQDLKARQGGVVHWESPEESLEAQYAERHEVDLREGGELQRLTGCRRMAVSSLHSQGVERLAPGLVAEAWADDGLVEASRWQATDRFAWAFQFHPEWHHERHARYARIMQAFRDACLDQLKRTRA